MSNDNRDDQKKDPLRQGEPKRPHATLELKAVEIKTPEQRAAAAKAAAGQSTSTASAEAKTGASAAAGQSATGQTAAAAQTAAKDSVKIDAGAKDPLDVAAAKDMAAPSAGSLPPPQQTTSGGGFGRFVSHTVAGLIGGFLALLGADTIAPQLGLPLRPSNTEVTEQLSQRLASLESAAKSQAQAGVGAKLTAALDGMSQRVAELEQIKERVAKLGEDHSQLRSDADVLKEKVAATPPPASQAAVPDPRIAKLEEQLALMSQASNSGSAAGALPELAAVTGKIRDLESTIANQIDALRKGVSADLDSRMGKAAEAAEAARSGTQRIDRELADVKTDAVRIGQRIEALKADNQRFSETLHVVQEETGKISSGLDAMKVDIDARFKSAAKPDDVSHAVAPVMAKIAALESSVASVVTAEESRKANAERIVLSLELANLKRVIDRGLGFAEELAQVKKSAGGKVDLATLEQYKAEGVPTLTALQSGFKPLAHGIIAAAEDTGEGGVLDRLLSGAKSVVKVRKVKHEAGDTSVEAVVGRMGIALEEGRIVDFQSLAQKLPDKAKAPATEFMRLVAARGVVDVALKQIEGQLKSSLGGAAQPAAAIQ